MNSKQQLLGCGKLSGKLGIWTVIWIWINLVKITLGTDEKYRIILVIKGRINRGKIHVKVLAGLAGPQNVRLSV